MTGNSDHPPARQESTFVSPELFAGSGRLTVACHLQTGHCKLAAGPRRGLRARCYFYSVDV